MPDVLAWYADAAALEPRLLPRGAPLAPGLAFGGGARSEAAFGGEDGFFAGTAFAADEVARIRDLIQDRLARNARSVSPAAAAAIERLPLDQYHRALDDACHAALLSKRGRMLPPEAVDEIAGMSFFAYAREIFGPFALSDEEATGHPQICFRVARPGQDSDVGGLHRDSWFWDHHHFAVPPGMGRAKMWVQLCGDPERSGLLLVPGSHRGPVGWRTEATGGRLGFVADPATGDPAWRPVRFRGAVGEPVLFNHDTLHSGTLNRGGECRVSIETTFLFPVAHG